MARDDQRTTQLNFRRIVNAAGAVIVRHARIQQGTAYRAKQQSLLCQNCVRYALKPRAHTVIYRDSPMHIVVAGSRW